ncbi:hypothetical protein [Enterococcus sp. AZ163]|uniref:hypothetical protein n=1 Tax=Enterococcus sp. AZ163 TaxID=2774638 RepID=UPI003D2B624A
MKKKNNSNFLMINKKQRKNFLGLGILLFFIVIGIIIGINQLSEKTNISAHPINKIKINAGESDEYEVPIDAIQLKEQELIDNSPKFDDYVQGGAIVPNTTKSNVVSYGSNDSNGNPVIWFINDIKKTPGGNYVVLFGASGGSRGGIIKISVIDASGKELNTRILGDLRNANFRVPSGFYETEANSYLFRTTSDRFFNCTIRNETSSSAIIDLTEVNTSQSGKVLLKVHEVLKVDTEVRSANKPIVTGSVYPDYSTESGIIKNRIPVGALDNVNWTNGSMTAGVDYLYSLENALFSEIFDDAIAIIPKLYMNNEGIIYGKLAYHKSKVINTVQIFSQKNVVVNGNNLKKREYYHQANDVYILNEISNKDKIYFLSMNDTNTQLIEVSLSTYKETVIRTFPSNTRLLITTNDDGSLSYYGSTSGLEGEFYSSYYSAKLNSSYYYVQGVMEGLSTAAPAKVKSLRAMELNSWLAPSHIVDTVKNEFLIGGETSDYQKFPDQSYVVNDDGSMTKGIPKYSGAFLGLIKVLDDYSPAISSGTETIDVDITSNAVNSPSDTFENPGDIETYRGWNSLDRWLITGSENGKISDPAAIKVYDHFDIDDPMIGATLKEREIWLQKRINRNPLDANTGIDWLALGFDKTKSGAQLVTYFVTDSQGQTSSTSRWINKKTDQTIEKDDHCFDAQNFHVPLSSVNSSIPDADTFKKFAKTMAWNRTEHGSGAGDHGNGLDEDGTDINKLSSKVIVDANQLKTLREATVAKPYPVDVVYKPKTGVEIKNRVWVFVTTKNTLPNSEVNPAVTPKDTNGVVYYADDYSIPFRLRGTQDRDEVLTRGKVKVYDYFDSAHETVAELPTLADAGKNANKLVVDFPTIQNALVPGVVKPTVTYNWDGVTDGNHTTGTATVGYLDVTLTGHTLWHVRQVVLGSSAEIVVPTKSYFAIQNILDNNGSPAIDLNYQANFTAESGKITDNPVFNEVSIPTDHLASINDQVQLSLINPEFYHYLGYYFTTEQNDPLGVSHQVNTSYTAGDLKLAKSTLNNDGEFWITMYIKPNKDDKGITKVPHPYSWDYKKNDLGKIKTK